jgi:molecular chaperone Hsp33
MLTHDYVRPFMLARGAVRGRITRLQNTSSTIIGRHDYPDAVSHLLAQLLALAALLSSQLKGEGIVTIQLRGSGPVSLVVVDAVVGGELRGYADIDAEQRDKLAEFPQDVAPRALLGSEGYLAITLDTGSAERYQGVVALEGDSLAGALEAYFANSQQLEMRCQIAAEKQHGAWHAGALLIERLAFEGGRDGGDEAAHEESWRYAQAMGQTLGREELLDVQTPLEDILFRLFHEEGVEIYDETSLCVGCRCSRERMLSVLQSMSKNDKTEMIINGYVAVHCQFCNQEQRFSANEIGVSEN